MLQKLSRRAPPPNLTRTLVAMGRDRLDITAVPGQHSELRGECGGDVGKLTLMLRGIACRLTQEGVKQILDEVQARVLGRRRPSGCDPMARFRRSGSSSESKA